jgi:hypothetical protein
MFEERISYMHSLDVQKRALVADMKKGVGRRFLVVFSVRENECEREKHSDFVENEVW